MASDLCKVSSLWWAYVTVTPEASRTAVFSRGTENGLIGHTPLGGQLQPSSIVGARLLWKKDQKNALKNITSDEMNKIIPHSKFLWTFDVWSPRNAPSRRTSRHQHIMVIRIVVDARIVEGIMVK